MSDRGVGPRRFPEKLIRLPKTRVLVQTRVRGAPIVHYVLTRSIPARLRFRETVRGSLGIIERGILAGAREGAATVEGAA
jgi:hypothetical protein